VLFCALLALLINCFYHHLLHLNVMSFEKIKFDLKLPTKRRPLQLEAKAKAEGVRSQGQGQRILSSRWRTLLKHSIRTRDLRQSWEKLLISRRWYKIETLCSGRRIGGDSWGVPCSTIANDHCHSRCLHASCRIHRRASSVISPRPRHDRIFAPVVCRPR